MNNEMSKDVGSLARGLGKLPSSRSAQLIPSVPVLSGNELPAEYHSPLGTTIKRENRILITGTHAEVRQVYAILDYAQWRQSSATTETSSNRQAQPETEFSAFVHAMSWKRTFSTCLAGLQSSFFNRSHNLEEVLTTKHVFVPGLIFTTGNIRADRMEQHESATLVNELLENLSTSYDIPLLKLGSDILKSLAQDATEKHFNERLATVQALGVENCRERDIGMVEALSLGFGPSVRPLIEDVLIQRRETLEQQPGKVELGDITPRFLAIISGKYNRVKHERCLREHQYSPLWSRANLQLSDRFLAKINTSFMALFQDIESAAKVIDFDLKSFVARFNERSPLYHDCRLNAYEPTHKGEEVTEFGKMADELLPLYRELRRRGYSHTDLV